MSTYTAESPCKHGHPPIRYLSTGLCVQCAKLNTKRSRDRRVLRYVAFAGIKPVTITASLHPEDAVQVKALVEMLQAQRIEKARRDGPPPLPPGSIEATLRSLEGKA